MSETVNNDEVKELTEKQLENIQDPKELDEIENSLVLAPDNDLEPPETTDNGEEKSDTDKVSNVEVSNPSALPDELINKYNLDKFKGKTYDDFAKSYLELEKKLGEKSEQTQKILEDMPLTGEIEDKLRQATIDRLKKAGVEYPESDEEYDDIALVSQSKIKKLDRAFDREYHQVIKEYRERVKYYQEQQRHEAELEEMRNNAPAISQKNLYSFLNEADELVKDAGLNFIDKDKKPVEEAVNKYINPLLATNDNGQIKLNTDVFDFYEGKDGTVPILNLDKLRTKFIATYGKQIIEMVKQNAVTNGRKEGFSGKTNADRITSMAGSPNRGTTPKNNDAIDPDKVYDLKTIDELLEKEAAKMYQKN